MYKLEINMIIRNKVISCLYWRKTPVPFVNNMFIYSTPEPMSYDIVAYVSDIELLPSFESRQFHVH